MPSSRAARTPTSASSTASGRRAAEDGIVYSINPQIHAFDELSLAENIAGQAETVQTARAYGGGRPVVVSPVTLKQRFNSVATGDQPEPGSRRAPAAGRSAPDVPLRARVGRVGSLNRLLESGVAAATYYETTGWRGVIQGDEPPPAPELFPARAGMVFPVYHVFADLAEWKDGQLVRSRSSDPLAVETLAVTDEGGLHLLVANLTPHPQTVTIDALSGRNVTLRRLNAETAEDGRVRSRGLPVATRRRCRPDGTRELMLAPFEVARLDWRQEHGDEPRRDEYASADEGAPRHETSCRASRCQHCLRRMSTPGRGHGR